MILTQRRNYSILGNTHVATILSLSEVQLYFNSYTDEHQLSTLFLVLKRILKYSDIRYYLGIRMHFLVLDHSFNVCACAETKHVQLLRKLNSGREVSCFMLLFF